MSEQVTNAVDHWASMELEIWAGVERTHRDAYKSYFVNCGPRAAECAEVDLLKKALDQMGHLIWLIEVQHKIDGKHITEDAKAIIAKAKGDEG